MVSGDFLKSPVKCPLNAFEVKTAFTFWTCNTQFLLLCSNPKWLCWTIFKLFKLYIVVKCNCLLSSWKLCLKILTTHPLLSHSSSHSQTQMRLISKREVRHQTTNYNRWWKTLKWKKHQLCAARSWKQPVLSSFCVLLLILLCRSLAAPYYLFTTTKEGPKSGWSTLGKPHLSLKEGS